jgi:hypothetical protein
VADVRIITGAAARWLIDHDRSGRTEADDAKLLAYVVGQTGLHENTVFDVLVENWAAVRAAASSSAAHKAAGGAAAAQLKAAGHESPPIPGVKIIPLDDTGWLHEGVLLRTATTDRKGRTYGTMRNPGVPPIEQFSPRFFEVRAGDLEGLIAERMHGRSQEQREAIAQLDDAALLRINQDDPVSARWTGDGLSLTGGHHRTWEIIDRVREGRIPADAPVRILVHE